MNKKLFGTVCIVFFVLVSFSIIFALDSHPMPGNKYYFIKSVQAGSQNLGYWDQKGVNAKFKDGANISLWANDKGKDQQFRFVSAGGGWYYIISGNGGYVDVAGGKDGEGVNIDVRTPNKSSSQKFRFVNLGDGKWKIFTFWGKVLNTNNRKYANGTNVETMTEENGQWVEWYLIDAKTNTAYAPVTIPAEPEFFTKNEDRAFNVLIGARESFFRGKAYIERRGGFGNLILVMHTTGPNPMNGKTEIIDSSMVLKYNSKTGVYDGYCTDGYISGKISGNYDGKSNTLSMKSSQGLIEFELTDKPKSSVVPENPDFFIVNKNKTFEFTSQGMESRLTGTASVKQISGNTIELNFETSGNVSGKNEKQRGVITLYYVEGVYVSTLKKDEPSVMGRAAGTNKKLFMGGDWGYTFEVK